MFRESIPGLVRDTAPAWVGDIRKMSGFGFRYGIRPRERDAFDPAAIVIDPQVPNAVQEELRARPFHGQGAAPAYDGLVRFRDPRPEVPRPPRSPAIATLLTWVAVVLCSTAIIAGVFNGAITFAVFFALGLADAAFAAAVSAAAKRGKPALAGGLIPLPPVSDLTGYHVMYAGRIFHRWYVRPRVDFDEDALTAWLRAVGAANRIYRAESMRDRVVDTDQVEAEVPELLWKIAEGLAKISDVRFNLKEIVPKQVVPGGERFHPAVEAKMKAQERYLARGTGQVNHRIDRLETVASRLEAADAARRDEELLKRLIEVDPKIRDLVASTDESIIEIDMVEGLKLDVEAIVAMTNQAISDLSVRDEDDDPSENPHLLE
jgi:hypothetical protein